MFTQPITTEIRRLLDFYESEDCDTLRLTSLTVREATADEVEQVGGPAPNSPDWELSYVIATEIAEVVPGPVDEEVGRHDEHIILTEGGRVLQMVADGVER